MANRDDFGRLRRRKQTFIALPQPISARRNVLSVSNNRYLDALTGRELGFIALPQPVAADRYVELAFKCGVGVGGLLSTGEKAATQGQYHHAKPPAKSSRRLCRCSVMLWCSIVKTYIDFNG
jgi:hypothetical protein